MGIKKKGSTVYSYATWATPADDFKTLFHTQYSRTSMARTLMARLPRLFQTSS